MALESLEPSSARSSAAERATLLLLLGFSWGLNWPIVRVALHEISPWQMRAFGFTGGTLVMFGLIAATGRSAEVPRRHWLRLVGIGLLTVVSYNLLSAFAQTMVPTSRAVVLSYTMPIWAVILSRLLLAEPIDRRRLLGLALGLTGLLSLGLPLFRDGQLSWGLALAILSGVVWAAGSVVIKRWPVDASPIVVTAWQIAMGAVLTIIGMLVVDGVPKRLPQETGTWIGIAYNAVIGQAVATTLWFTMLGRMPAGIASIGSLLVPGIGVIGATIILGERPTATDWLGLVLIIAASATVLLPSRRPIVTATDL